MSDHSQSDQHVAKPNKEVKNEQQEVAQVVETETVVDPGAVMVHDKHTLLAHRAVVRPCWLHLVTVATVFLNEHSVRHSLVSVLEQLLDICAEPFESVVF